MNISYVGDGKVHLIAKPNKCYIDTAAKIIGSNRDFEDIIVDDYNKTLVNNILNSGHLAVAEFDYWIFGVEGFSRNALQQLVRKRVGASYAISSDRINKTYSVIPHKEIMDLRVWCKDVWLTAEEYFALGERFFNEATNRNIPIEKARDFKPSCSEFRGIIGMNSRALLDWFGVRCCMRAQDEIRDMANKMLKICKEHSPDVFKNAGARCIDLGYCPEQKQHPACNKIKKEEALKLIGGNKNV